jgi:PAS domain S-box-containing protein
MDIAASPDVQNRLREAEERFRGSFDSAAIGMALVAPDGHWLEVNPALCELVGYSEEELLGGTFQGITHPDDLDADLEFVRRMLAGEIETYQMDKRYFHKRGHIIWIRLSVSLVRSSDGSPAYFVSQIQDIGEQRRAHELDERLRRSQGLDAMLREARLPELLRELTIVAAGGASADPEPAGTLASGQAAGASSPLTKREQQVLGLAADGMTNEKAAGALGISPETVQSHIRNAMLKLGADTRTQAVATAFRRSLLS